MHLVSWSKAGRELVSEWGQHLVAIYPEDFHCFSYLKDTLKEVKGSLLWDLGKSLPYMHSNVP